MIRELVLVWNDRDGLILFLMQFKRYLQNLVAMLIEPVLAWHGGHSIRIQDRTVAARAVPLEHEVFLLIVRVLVIFICTSS